MSEQRSSGWAGWSMFAGIMLVVAGAFQMLYGLVALVDDEFYVVGAKYTFEFDTTTWGWIHLLIGAVALLCGLGIFIGNIVARTVGVLAAVGSMVSAFMWLPYYPVWGFIVIAICVLVIWALTVHGRDITADK